jgi:hypothetical protein
MRVVVVAALLTACSSKDADPIDAAPDVALDGAFDETAIDTDLTDIGGGACGNVGDPCTTNMDCCSTNCVGVSDSEAGILQYTCR